jgi:disulfide bond formation protein DsbB
MPMNTPVSRASTIAFLVPLFLLAGAFYFQFGMGLYPCEMCVWQRWPHIIALYLGCIALLMATRHHGLARGFAVLGGLAIIASGAIGFFHAGVEYKWWEGITACAVTATTEITLDSIMDAPMVSCNTAPWSLLGISIAGYNGIISTLSGLTVIGLALKKA